MFVSEDIKQLNSSGEVSNLYFLRFVMVHKPPTLTGPRGRTPYVVPKNIQSASLRINDITTFNFNHHKVTEGIYSSLFVLIIADLSTPVKNAAENRLKKPFGYSESRFFFLNNPGIPPGTSAPKPAQLISPFRIAPHHTRCCCSTFQNCT